MKSSKRPSLLGVLALAAAALFVAAPAVGQELSAAGQLDLSYVPESAVAAVIAFPSRVLKAPEMEMLPHEVFAAAGKKEMGLDPADIDEVLVVVEASQGGPPGVGAVVRFSKPYPLDGLLPEVASRTSPGELDGKPYLKAASPMEPSLFMPDDRTLLVGMDPMLQKMVANAKQPTAGPLSKLLAATRTTADLTAVAVVEPVREMLGAVLAMSPVPPPLEDVKKLPDLVKAAKIEMSFVGTPRGTIVLLAPDENKAVELEASLNKMIDFGQQMAMQQMSQEMGQPDDPVEQATAQYMVRLSKYVSNMLRPKRNGTVLSISQGGDQTMQIASTGVVISLLLPAVQGARSAARRAQSSNNLKQLALAMHNYHDTYKKFPGRAITDDAGKPLLSWRVSLLPFVDEAALYDQFHLDEPWDSPHNKQLLNQMPNVYKRPNSPVAAPMTTYLAPAGEGTIWSVADGAKMRDIRDGTSNTIMIVEADDAAAVPWTKPEDLEYDPSNPMQNLGNSQPGGFQAALVDGSVRFLSKTLDAETLKALFSMDGGERVSIDF